MHFHHLGIIVENIEKSLNSFKKILKAEEVSKIIIDKNWKIKLIFLKDRKNILFEIIEPLNKLSPVYNTLKNSINILNHIAYTTSHFEKDKKNILKNGGLPVTSAIKALAFKNKKVQFFITKEKFLIELIQK